MTALVRCRLLLAPLFLLNGDMRFDDGAADEDELLAEASDMHSGQRR